jgi:hypothetical protein
MRNRSGYVPSQFTHKDYKKLFDIAKSSSLRILLHEARYRDKRIQREIGSPSYDKFKLELLKCPLEELPLHVNEDTIMGQDIVKWRLTIAK